MIEYGSYRPGDASAIEALFGSVFSADDGDAEGALIGTLAKELMAGTDRQDLYGFVAVDQEQLIGAIFFSRLRFKQDLEAFLLAPVAVHDAFQGKGVGQELITYGRRALEKNGVEIVVTYGDPAFYAKVGFQPVSQETVPAPFELSHPEGWLGQSLTGDPIAPIAGPCSCVKAFENPAYW
jgi:predicted N-acetyltransferase YhbS